MANQLRISLWPAYMLGAIGTAWLMQEIGALSFSLPLGPIAIVWCALTFLLLIRQIQR